MIYERKEAVDEITYETPDVEMTKNGSTEAENPRVIKWIVRINPSKQEYNPDLNAVIFNDTLPEGLLQNLWHVKLLFYNHCLHSSFAAEVRAYYLSRDNI